VAEKTFADVLTQATLASLAHGESFARGKRYLEQGRVKALKESDGVISARVRGSDWYSVELRLEPVGLRGRCSCPVGIDDLFCKHCVATGLAWLVREALATHERTGAGSPQAMKEYLTGLPRGKLVELVMRQAQADPALRQQLVLAIARSRPGEPDEAAIRLAIDDAARADEPWSRTRDADRVRKLEAVLDVLGELLEAGHAAAVRELAAFGLERTGDVAGRMYDPGQELAQVASQFLSLHVRSCAASQTDPVALARWLFEFELSSDMAAHSGIYARYIELLGEKGLAAYRQFAVAEWQAAHGSDRRHPTVGLARLDAAMYHAALLTVDPALMSELGTVNFSYPWAYWHAAQECLDLRQPDKALVWAELGLKAFPTEPSKSLRQLLADEYARRGRTTEALNQVWAMFTEGPDMDSYLRLRALANKAKQAAVWRDEALEYLKERAARAPKAKPGEEPDGERLRCGSLIVEILLKEKNIDAAWNEAHIGGCGEETWLKLARAREATHPADAIRIYQQFAEQVVQGGGDFQYRAATRYLLRAEALAAKLGRPDKFREFLAGYRERNKRKKNLLWFLDRELDLGD